MTCKAERCDCEGRMGGRLGRLGCVWWRRANESEAGDAIIAIKTIFLMLGTVCAEGKGAVSCSSLLSSVYF